MLLLNCVSTLNLLHTRVNKCVLVNINKLMLLLGRNAVFIHLHPSSLPPPNKSAIFWPCSTILFVSYTIKARFPLQPHYIKTYVAYSVAIELPGGNRIRRINMKAQHSAFSRAINRTVS